MNGKAGYINKKGDVKIAAMYDDASAFYTDGYAVVQLGVKYGIIDEDAQTVIAPMYDGFNP